MGGSYSTCKATSEDEYFDDCIPQIYPEHFDETTAARYRQYMRRWKANDPEYTAASNVLYGCRWAEEYLFNYTEWQAHTYPAALIGSSKKFRYYYLFCVSVPQDAVQHRWIATNHLNDGVPEMRIFTPSDAVGIDEPYDLSVEDAPNNNKEDRWVPGAYHSFGSYNETVIINYQKARERMRTMMLIDDAMLDEIWHLFYFPYEPGIGMDTIEDAIAQLRPGPFAEGFLRRPRDLWIQCHFQLCNEPAIWLLGATSVQEWGLFMPMGISAKRRNNVATKQMLTSIGAIGMTSFISGGGTGGDYSQGGTKWFIPPEGFNNSQMWGDPLWTYTQRRYAARRILPEWDGESFLEGWVRMAIISNLLENGARFEDASREHPGKVNPFDGVDGYSGKLPSLPVYLQENAEPWVEVYTKDENAEGYEDPCLDRSTMETLLPIAAGVAGALVGSAVVPGDAAAVSAALTLGGTGYYVVYNTFGYQAWKRTFDNHNLPEIQSPYQNLAPEILGIGGPVTGLLVLDELGQLPVVASENFGVFVLGSAAISYFVLVPYLRDVVKIGDKAVVGLLTPVSHIDRAISNIFSGCSKAVATRAGRCTCAKARQKPQLIHSIVADVIGTTGDQQTMRKQCMRGAMTRGLWGDDPVRIGDCLASGLKTNPGACLSPGEWGHKRIDENDELLNGMYGQIEHCMDADNPSFLPPRSGVDDACLAHGPHFRKVGDACLNLSAPKGLQEPGQWPDGDTSTNECVIL